MADAARRPVLVVTTGYDEYQRWLVRGVRSVLPPDRHTIVVNSFNPTKRGLARPVVELVRELRPYGVLATSCVSPREETGLVDLLSELGVPTVRIGAETPGMSCVRGDDATGMREVLRFLLDERGVRRPVLARGVPHQPDSLCRERVFREELAVRGIAVDEDLIIEGFFWHEATYRELRALLGRRRDLDAVVALNDLSALGAVKALGDEGLRVPEDVLVTGFDNDPAALPCWPQLTTVDPALEEQGAAAAAQLLAEVEHDAPRTEIVVPARLIVRGSTGLPPDCLAAAVSAATVGQQQLAARDALSALSFALSNCATPEDVVSTLGTSHLLRLGIRRFFLAVHVDGIRAPAGQEGTELRSRLLLDFREGRQWPVPEQVFPLTRLLPDDLAAELDGMLVFQPLTSGDHLIGYMLLEPCESSSGLVADALRTDLSRTLDAMFSTQALTDHAQELERTVAERTAELRARTAELESEVAIRRQAELDLQSAVAELHRLAMNDSLTGIANRTAMRRHLADRWEALAEVDGELAVLMIDVDLFKAFNDAYGHLSGDEALRIVSATLVRAARSPDALACRFGGEEFALILPGGDAAAAYLVAERFRQLLAEAAIPHRASTVAPVVTTSIGICAAGAMEDLDPWSLLQAADRALYLAKTRGRDQVCVVDLDGMPVEGLPAVPGPRRPDRPGTGVTPTPAPPAGWAG